MSDPRTIRTFQALQGKLTEAFGYSNTPALFTIATVQETSGSNTTLAAYNGYLACVLDYTNATWASNNQRAVIVALPAWQALPASMITQSNALGLQGPTSYSFALLVEGSAAVTEGTTSAAKTAMTKFQLDLLQHLRGQQGSEVRVLYSDTAVQPAAGGVGSAANASTPDANLTDIGTLIAYKFATAGGV